MAAHRYWRVNFTAITNPGNSFAIAELKLCTALAGATVATGGTASAQSIFSGSFPASDAFDGNLATFWHSAGGVVPQWLKYDFGLGNDKDIIEVGVVMAPSRAHQQPTAFTVQHSDDNVAWTDAWSVADTGARYSLTSTQGQVERRFTNPAIGGKTYWRIWATNVDASNDSFGVNELGFATSVSGPTVTTGGIAQGTSQFSTSFPPANAFDGSSATRYAARETLATAATLGFPLALGYHFAAAQAIAEVIIENRSDGTLPVEGRQAPEAFTLQSSPDGETWTDEASFSGIVWSSQGQVQRFALASGVDVEPGTGALEFTGYAPTITVSVGVSPGPALLEFTGYAPTAMARVSVSPAVGELEFSGEAPTALVAFRRARPGTAELEWEGYAPTIGVRSTVSPGPAELEFEGFPPWINFVAVTSQAAVLVLAEVPTPSRGSQIATLALGEVVPGARASGMAGLVLGEVIPSNRVTSMPLLVLAEAQPCLTQRCQLWKITRRDGVVLGFTSHDRDVGPLNGVTYRTCASLMPSASESSSSLGSVGNIDLEGVIASDAITEEDLYGGLYDDAEVTVDLFSWGDEGDTIKRLAAGWTGEMSQGDSGFKMEVLGPGIRLAQQPIVQEFTPGCRWVFGDARCGVDIEALGLDGEVTVATQRDNFACTLSGGAGASQWENGRVVWLTGRNAGLVTEVKDVAFDAESTVVLWALTSFVPTAGDTFRLLPGCDKAKTGGCTLYANIINFGGFPDVPGMDAILETPDAQY